MTKRLFVGKNKAEDRFTIITTDGEIGVKENRSGDVLVLMHDDLNAQQFVAQLVVFLNDQNQAIVDLYDGSKYWSDKATERIKELEKENEQLKSRINDYNVALKRLQDLADRKLKENEQLKKQIERIDFILDDLNGAEYISRDDGIKALNKIDKVIGKR